MWSTYLLIYQEKYKPVTVFCKERRQTGQLYLKSTCFFVMTGNSALVLAQCLAIQCISELQCSCSSSIFMFLRELQCTCTYSIFPIPELQCNSSVTGPIFVICNGILWPAWNYYCLYNRIVCIVQYSVGSTLYCIVYI